MDPITIFAACKAAHAGIKECVELYNEFKQDGKDLSGIVTDISQHLGKFFTHNEEFKVAEKESQKIPLPKNIDYSFIEKTFLCLNNRQRPHRKNLFVLWNLNNLINDSFYTMNNKSGFEQDVDNLYHLRDYVDSNLMARVGVSLEDIDKMEETLPLVLDRCKDVSEMSFLFGQIDTYYQRSLISVVTETNFEIPDIFNTEKIFKPMIHRHPFILIGPYKTLAKLREMGYQTFSDFWDESYDEIQDPNERLLKIVELCKVISQWSDGEKKRFFYKSMVITNHNYKMITGFYPDNMRENFWHRFRDVILYNKKY